MNKTRYELEKYVPIPLCNSYSLHLLKSHDNDLNLLERLQLFITDTNGLLYLIDESENRSWDLKEHVQNEEILEDFSLELVCSDLGNFGCENDETLLAYIGSCWVFYDDLFRPRLYMLVFLRFNKDYSFERLSKIEIDFAPTCTQIRLNYWLIFGHNSSVKCYINEGDSKIVELDNFVERFPALRPDSIFGSMTRIDQLTIENFQFEIMGFDTGYLVASVCSTQDNVLLDRKLIKYNTPISIACFVNMGFVDQEIFVVISSTIGPAALWTLKFDHEKQTLKWQVRCQLLESDKNDCVMSGTVTDDTIIIGTYTEQLLFYSIKSALCFSEIGPMNQLNVGAPILSLTPLYDSLLVLSTKGLQKYNCTVDDDSETNILPSSNSSSPIQYLTSD